MYLDEIYKSDLTLSGYIERKVTIPTSNVILWGMPLSGVSMLVKSYLHNFKRSKQLYINCQDERLNIAVFNQNITPFCREHSIEVVVYEHFNPLLHVVQGVQVILTSYTPLYKQGYETLHVTPLDFEEFLAYEHHFDSTALNHFITLGALPIMHTIDAYHRPLYLQQHLQLSLSATEYQLLKLVSLFNAQKRSAYQLYMTLKEQNKTSKNSVYSAFEALKAKTLLYGLEKFEHPKATKKLYVGDVSLIYAFSTSKHFIRIFETLIALELFKQNKTLYYAEGVHFYIPDENRVILATPFIDERTLFTKIASIEAFVFTHQVTRIEAVSMSSEATLTHPIASVELIEFSRWALME